jgi:carbonic anhydrase/acetyltransferase-like protein (isoleucine patch superfamily)/acyl carrier protein
MVPSAFVAMDAFPLLPNGKVNTKALPMPTNAFEEEEYVPPRNEVDAVIQGIWQDVLGLDFSVSIDSDFFDIGGSSLKAGIIAARITKALGVEIAGKTILSERTIRRVSDALGSDRTIQLRVPTRRILGQTTLKHFFPDVNAEKTKKFGIEARMNASDLDLGEYLSRKPPPASLLTRIFSAALMILCGLFATVLTPLVSSLTFSSMSLVQGEPTFKSGWWLFLIGPGLYLGMMVCGFIIVPALKWILFPMKMTPGVYPLYGWTYARWMAYNAVYRRVCGFLWPHMGGTWMWTAWLRLQGARIGKNATIFTQSLFEPDLVSVGQNTIIDDDALLTAAIVVPRGTFSNQGFLILSTTLVEEDCKVGRRAVLQAGSRLRAGHSLRPYGSTHSHHAVKKIGEDSEYPMFRPESGMTFLTSTVASCTMSFLNTLSYIPGCALAIACVAWAYSIPPLDFPAAIFGSLSYAPRGSAQYFKVIFLPVAGTLASGLVLTPVTMLVQYLMLALWKGVAVGKLSPGRRLQSQWDLFAYKVYINLQNAAMWGLMKMYLHTTVLSNPAYRLLGAKVGSDAHVDGISEMEAVTIGDQATTGGDSVFRNIDETGTIHKIEVGNAASFGHTTFFPGCEVGAYSIIGNETLVQANRKVPESHNLQGDLLYPGGASRPADSDLEGQTGEGKKEPRVPKFDVFAPGTKSPLLHTLMAVYRTSYIVFLTFFSEAMVNAVCWAPGSTALTVVITYVRVEAGWGVGPTVGVSIVIILCIIPIGLLFLGLWMRAQLLLYRGYGLWRKESVAGDSLRVRMLALAELRMQNMSESFKGTYIFNWLMRLAGWKVGKGSVIFGSMPQELTLLNPGNYSVLETGAVISTHYVQSGRVYYNNVAVGDDSWVQNRTRVLAANSVGSYARILPASMVLPNEDIPADSIWAGVPAQTAGQKKEYRTLPDVGILRGESLIRRSEADSRKLRSTMTSVLSSRVSAMVSDGIRLRDRLGGVGKKIFKRRN